MTSWPHRTRASAPLSTLLSWRPAFSRHASKPLGSEKPTHLSWTGYTAWPGCPHHLSFRDSPGGLTGLRRAVLAARVTPGEGDSQGRGGNRCGLQEHLWRPAPGHTGTSPPSDGPGSPQVSGPRVLPGAPPASSTDSGREAAARPKPHCLRHSLRTVTIPIREHRKPPKSEFPEASPGPPACDVGTSSPCDRDAALGPPQPLPGPAAGALPAAVPLLVFVSAYQIKRVLCASVHFFPWDPLAPAAHQGPARPTPVAPAPPRAPRGPGKPWRPGLKFCLPSPRTVTMQPAAEADLLAASLWAGAGPQQSLQPPECGPLSATSAPTPPHGHNCKHTRPKTSTHGTAAQRGRFCYPGRASGQRGSLGREQHPTPGWARLAERQGNGDSARGPLAHCQPAMTQQRAVARPPPRHSSSPLCGLTWTQSWGQSQLLGGIWAPPTPSDLLPRCLLGFPGGTSAKEPACQWSRHKRCRCDPWVGKIPWRRAWQPAPVFLPGEPHGQRSLAGYRPWGRRVGCDCVSTRTHTSATSISAAGLPLPPTSPSGPHTPRPSGPNAQ